MKTLKIMAICLSLMPIAASAQKNIKQAFDSFVNNPEVSVAANHSVEKDPKTGVKESQCDTYSFSLSQDNAALLKDLEKAFQKDSEDAYHMGSGVGGKNPQRQPVPLAVGNGNSGVVIGNSGMSYTFASFIAPEDKSGNHRYAYAMEWKEDGDKIIGTLAITYATTQKYRQEKGHARNVTIDKNGNVNFGSNLAVHYADTWFDMFTGYVSSMGKADPATRLALASKLYQHTKMKGMKIDEDDKNTAREILKTLMSDSDFSDPVILELLNGAMINIK